MNPTRWMGSTYSRGGFAMQIPNSGPPAQSQFERDLENAKQYFGDDFPGNEGLTCLQCGAAVNLGWKHIAWHEATA